jgi:hypothetical protein
MYWLNSMLSGNDDTVSSKRVVTLLAFLLCASSMIAEQYFNYKIDPKIYDSMMYIVIAGLGFTASEKFTSKQGK